MNLTNLKAIKSVCKRYGIIPSKNKGQNFLIDRAALDLIAGALHLGPDDTILEIGPGTGVLTRELCAKAGNVVAVELDKGVIEMLKETTRDCKNLEIIQADILSLSDREILEIILEDKTLLPPASSLQPNFKLVANIPYNITSAILRKFLENAPRPQEMALLMQKEVAQRAAARPGKMSLLSVSVQYYGHPEIVGFVDRSSFWPVPEVDSAVLKITGIGRGLPEKLSLEEEKAFFRLARIGFSARRKQLQKNLSGGLRMEAGEIMKIMGKCGIGPRARAQDLSLENWADLSRELLSRLK